MRPRLGAICSAAVESAATVVMVQDAWCNAQHHLGAASGRRRCHAVEDRDGCDAARPAARRWWPRRLYRGAQSTRVTGETTERSWRLEGPERMCPDRTNGKGLKHASAVGRFFEQLRDRNTWPRRLWYPRSATQRSIHNPRNGRNSRQELQSLIKTTILTTVGFSVFCLLALATPDASILDAKSKVKIALLNIDIDYTSFLYVGPMVIIALSLYIHMLLEEWFDKLKPQTKDAVSVDMYTMSPDIFNIQAHRFAGIIYNCFFYWMPIFVLICFALKWIPQHEESTGDGLFDVLVKHCYTGFNLDKNSALS